MAIFTVDQAGKIEATKDDTILAFCSQEIQYTIKIPRLIKQDLFNQCDKRYKKYLIFRIFSYALYLLLKGKVNKDSLVIIDKEYPGHERDIKQLLLNNLKIEKNQIRFESIGKMDLAHRIANQTFSGKLKPNEVIDDSKLNIHKIVPKRKIKIILK